MEKIDFLKKYHHDIKIIKKDEIESITQIPISWKKLLNKNIAYERVKETICLWKVNVGKELSSTISYLEENLRDVELVSYNGTFSLLYSIVADDGEIEYYEGKNYIGNTKSDILEKNWSRFPEKIKEFYEKLHNGFFYYASESMGLYPTEDIVYLDDYEWGILDEIDEVKINFKTSFGVFGSGAGGYVVIDVENCQNNNSTLWFSSDTPDYNVNFWDVVDEWIVIGMKY